jgi:ABC-type amino acid transport substrate-binding protein
MNNRFLKNIFFVSAIFGFGLLIFFFFKNHNGTPANTMIVGTNTDYYPYSFIQDNKPAGFDIDLMNHIATRLGKSIKWQDMPFDALIPAAQLGQVHIIAAGITATPERAQRILFTKPYLQQDPLLIISHKETPVTNVFNLAGKTVAVNEGFMADLYMSKIPGINLLRLATPTEAFLALQSNRADAFVGAQTSVKPFFDKYGTDNFSITPIPDAADSYSFAVSPTYPELLKQVQQVLDELEKEGVIAQLAKKWKLQ